MHVVSSGGYYGAERVIVELSLGLVDIGWNVLILALESHGSPSLLDRVGALGLPFFAAPVGTSLAAQRGIIDRLARERRIDIVHSHGYKGDLLVATQPLPLDVRRVATCHGWITTSPKLALYECADKVALRRFDRIAAVSSSIRSALLRWGVPVDRVRLVENGVAEAAPEADAGPRVRAELAVPPTRRLLLCVSRLDPGKGIADAVQATARLLARGHDVALVVAGDGEERAPLHALARSTGIVDRVHLLGYRSDVNDLMAAADVFVVPSYSEGLPITLLEAMALARPIVATRVGEIDNVLGASGILLEPGNVEALAAAIERILLQPNEAKCLGAAVRDRYRLRYSRQAMTDRYCSLYDA